MESLSENLARHRERRDRARQNCDLGAIRWDTVRGAPNRRREENSRISAITEQEQVDKVLADLRSYIGSLHRAQINNWEQKTEILWARYARSLPWQDVACEVFGDRADFAQRRRSYMRRVYRLHEQALEEIWKS